MQRTLPNAQDLNWFQQSWNFKSPAHSVTALLILGFPWSWGYPPNGWFIVENTIYKRMIWGYPHGLETSIFALQHLLRWYQAHAGYEDMQRENRPIVALFLQKETPKTLLILLLLLWLSLLGAGLLLSSFFGRNQYI